MPIYSYECLGCGYKFEEKNSISERLEPTKSSCCKCQQKKIILVLGTPGFVDPIRIGVRKVPEVFKDRLKEIKKKHPGSKINTF